MQNIQEMPPYVTFETRSVEDRTKEIESGRYAFRDIHIAKITRPGQRDTVEKEAKDWLKDLDRKSAEGAIPANWAPHFRSQYDAWRKGEEVPLSGVPILGWALAQPAEQKNLIHLGFRTLEDLANASDEAVQKIGMGAVALKMKAKAWLEESKEKGVSAAEITALRIENASLRDSFSSLQKEVAAMKADQIAGKIAKAA